MDIETTTAPKRLAPETGEVGLTPHNGSTQRHLSSVWYEVTPLEVVSGQGSVVTTTNGTRYLDFTSGIAVTSTGHCHPDVVRAIQEQAARFVHAQANIYRHPLREQLAARLATVTPAGIDTFFFANSGAEAVESAVKLARQATGRPNLIVFRGGFHGRSTLTMAMTTSRSVVRSGYQPLPAGVFIAPYARSDDEIDFCIDELRHILATQTAPGETAAAVIEPVLGEGGYVAAPARFLVELGKLCKEHGILVIADEIQTGFGRTGTMFALDHAGVVPDILVMAKGMASGFPISAVGASRELFSSWPVGSHGGTYGGNPIGCAAALATIDVITQDGFMQNVTARGDQLTTGLQSLQKHDDGATAVTGRGLMLGVAFTDPETGVPAGDRVAAILAHCRQQGNLLLMNAGSYGEVVRWMPPLVVTQAEIDTALEAFGHALGATASLVTATSATSHTLS
jgi:4-aminobutyrate aminotransferase